MMPKTFKKNETHRRGEGFTIVELLVVIVIISLFLALLFPVLMKARMQGFQSSSISNLHQIGEKLQQYQLDHDGHSPPVLFGYAVDSFVGPPTNSLSGPTAPMDSAYSQAAMVPNESQLYFPGLYPSYISDWHVFVDPENPAANTDITPPTTDFNVLCPNADDACDGIIAKGTLVVAKHTTNNGAQALPGTFYALDSYDVSPQIIANNQISSTVWVPRYQTSWTCLETGSGACLPTAPPLAPFAVNYSRQLRVPSPSGDAYVTSDTYFVNHTGKILVLYQNGDVKTVDVQQFIGSVDGPDVADIATLSPIPGPNASPSNLWQISPGN